jgi:hypothetical protein
VALEAQKAVVNDGEEYVFDVAPYIQPARLFQQAGKA